MTDIAAAARATRKYWPAPIGATDYGVFFGSSGTGDPRRVDGVVLSTYEQAVAASDIMSLHAVLEAIRFPSEAMVAAGAHRARRDQIPGHVLAENWRVMVDALIAELIPQTSAPCGAREAEPDGKTSTQLPPNPAPEKAANAANAAVFAEQKGVTP